MARFSRLLGYTGICLGPYLTLKIMSFKQLCSTYKDDDITGTVNSVLKIKLTQLGKKINGLFCWAIDQGRTI